MVNRFLNTILVKLSCIFFFFGNYNLHLCELKNQYVIVIIKEKLNYLSNNCYIKGRTSKGEDTAISDD